MLTLILSIYLASSPTIKVGQLDTSDEYAVYKLGVGAHGLLDALKDLLFLSRPLFSDPLQQRIIAKCDAAIRAVE